MIEIKSLGIVGHGQEKFTKETEERARKLIMKCIEKVKPHEIISGNSPMGGVDWYARDAANDYGIPIIEHTPKVKSWNPEGQYGYMKRNLDIASDSHCVLCVVVKELPPGYNGMTFDQGCYHCKGRNEHHIKSGGCWTAWKCRDQRWLII